MKQIEIIPVGMAEIKIARGPATLTALGLGSCIGLVACCPRTRIAGMIHIMLPESFPGREVDKIGKFADTGIPEMLLQLKSAGAGSNLLFAYAGGAQVFSFGQKGSLDIGARNAAAVAQHLSRIGGRVIAKDIGGSQGRTMNFHTETMEVTVKTTQKGLNQLCRMAA